MEFNMTRKSNNNPEAYLEATTLNEEDFFGNLYNVERLYNIPPEGETVPLMVQFPNGCQLSFDARTDELAKLLIPCLQKMVDIIK